MSAASLVNPQEHLRFKRMIKIACLLLSIQFIVATVFVARVYYRLPMLVEQYTNGQMHPSHLTAMIHICLFVAGTALLTEALAIVIAFKLGQKLSPTLVQNTP